jgi:hypothetical protein
MENNRDIYLKERELTRQTGGSYLGRKRTPLVSSREKRELWEPKPVVMKKKTIIQRITVIGWMLIAFTLGVVVSTVVINL